MVDVNELRARALRLAQLGAEKLHAFAEEMDAEAMFLDAVVAAIQPALPVLCSRIKATSQPVGGGVTWTYLSDPEQPLTEALGVAVYESAWGMVGEDLVEDRVYLLASGKWLFHRLEAEDPANGTMFGFKTSEAHFFVDTHSFVRTMRGQVRAEQLGEKISQIVDAQLNGDISKRTESARTRADRLRAVATLVRPPADRKVIWHNSAKAGAGAGRPPVGEGPLRPPVGEGEVRRRGWKSVAPKGGK
jgi:hypothetical protein